MGLWSWLRGLFGASDGGGGYGDEFKQLVRLARGDRERAERLVAMEQRKDPTLSRAEAIRRAAERLDYEMSR